MGSTAEVLLGIGAWGAQVIGALPAGGWPGVRVWHGPRRWRCAFPGGARRSGPPQVILRQACSLAQPAPGQGAGEVHLFLAAHLHQPAALAALLNLLAGSLSAALPKTRQASITLALGLDTTALDELPADRRGALWAGVQRLAAHLQETLPSPGGARLEACFLLDQVAVGLSIAGADGPPPPAGELQAEMAAALACVLAGGLRTSQQYTHLSLEGLRASLRPQGARPWVAALQLEALTFLSHDPAHHALAHQALARQILADGLAAEADPGGTARQGLANSLAAQETARGWQRESGLLPHDLSRSLRTRPGGAPLAFALPELALRWAGPPWPARELLEQLDAWQQEAQRRWDAPRGPAAFLAQTARAAAEGAARGLGAQVDHALDCQPNGTAAARRFLNEAAGCVQDLRYSVQTLLSAAVPHPTLADRALRWAARLPHPPDPAACRADLEQGLQQRSARASALRALFDPSLPLLRRANPLRAVHLVLTAAAADWRVRLAAWREVEALQAVYDHRLNMAISQACQSLFTQLLEGIALRQSQVDARWNALSGAAHLLGCWSNEQAQRQPWWFERVFPPGSPPQFVLPDPQALAAKFLAQRPPLQDPPALARALLAFSEQTLQKEQAQTPEEHPLLECAVRALCGTDAPARPAALLEVLLRRTQALTPALTLTPVERERCGIDQLFIGAPAGLLRGASPPRGAVLFTAAEENRVWLVRLLRGIDLLTLSALDPIRVGGDQSQQKPLLSETSVKN